VGNDATWSADLKRLFVRKGNKGFQVAVSAPKRAPEQVLADEKELAQRILGQI
jgi:hypothetical protein